MGLAQLNLEGRTKDTEAINILQRYEPSGGYYLAFSGGKDSVTIYDLAIKAGVKFDAHYCVSPIDPPQIYQFIKKHYPDVQWDFHARGWWKLVVQKGLPTRRSRWCCEYIKESGGLGRTVIVGSRSEEGSRRRKQRGFERHSNKDITFVRPIITWKTSEVWEYIRKNDLPSCILYSEGFKRIGCILCPLANIENRLREIERFPKVTRLWRLACDRLVQRRLAQGKDKFCSGEELWDWWLSQ